MILAVLTTFATSVRAQNYPREYLGLPGDNLNLYAVMDLFRNSETLEGFEKSLNSPDLRINNLDLNGDNMVDYITVSDFVNKKVHTIVLRAILGPNDYQDVAVITVQMLKKRKVLIQMIGDEALYGPNYIIEPFLANKSKQRFYVGELYADNYYTNNTIEINNYYTAVYEWPLIVFIYDPHYMEWHSPWFWGYYPDWWFHWSPWYWHFYHGYHSCRSNHYYAHYHHWDYVRYSDYHDFYYNGIRRYSPQVHNNIDEGLYNATYSKPELRREGANYFTNTRLTNPNERSRDGVAPSSRRVAPGAAVNTGEVGRRTAPARESVRSATVTTTRRVSENGSEELRESQRRETETREAPRRATEVREAEAREAQKRDMERREAEAREAQRREMESRAAEAREAQRREMDSRAAEAREAQRREMDSRAAEAREAQRREMESRAAEAREAQRREAENRAAEAREAQRREAESRAAEAREAQRREAESREAEAREAQRREMESRAAEARETQRRELESRAAEAREAQRREAENRAAEAREAQRREIESRAAEARRRE